MRRFEVIEKEVNPKITVAKDRVTLKFPATLDQKTKDHLIAFAHFIDRAITDQEQTLRGGFQKDGSVALCERRFQARDVIHRFVLESGEFKQTK